MYKTFVRLLFDYCNIIYHIPSKTNPYGRSVTLKYLMERLEKIQYPGRGEHVPKLLGLCCPELPDPDPERT